MTDAALVEVSKLTFCYHTRAALTDVSFRLQPGITMLLGPNGAGKSTLFALLTQMYRLQQGHILFAGRPLNELGYRANARLGVVFQQQTLDMDLSIRQNLCYFGALHGLNHRQSLEQAAPLLATFALTERLDDKVRTLNTGHRRRLEIVRALMHRPAILLLDEPSVGLDPGSRRELIATVRQYCAAHQVCVLWATHLLDEPQTGDQLLLLHQGRLLAQGQCAELLSRYGADTVAQLFSQLMERAQ
ncbi:ATP-binding cassette domain-containing protein [Shewanella sp. GXUN23E]|uniref:ATP-binding cassette domain-containing protein n=1 Tax=Shewanella sp. GXUN23E TaxID=3422498 RepID=UPI003D7EC06C